MATRCYWNWAKFTLEVLKSCPTRAIQCLPPGSRCTVEWPIKLRPKGERSHIYSHLVKPDSPGPFYVLHCTLWDFLGRSKLSTADFVVPTQDPGPSVDRFRAKWDEKLSLYFVSPLYLPAETPNSTFAQSPSQPNGTDESTCVNDLFDIDYFPQDLCLNPYWEDQNQYDLGLFAVPDMPQSSDPPSHSAPNNTLTFLERLDNGGEVNMEDLKIILKLEPLFDWDDELGGLDAPLPQPSGDCHSSHQSQFSMEGIEKVPKQKPFDWCDDYEEQSSEAYPDTQSGPRPSQGSRTFQKPGSPQKPQPSQEPKLYPRSTSCQVSVPKNCQSSRHPEFSMEEVERRLKAETDTFHWREESEKETVSHTSLEIRLSQGPQHQLSDEYSEVPEPSPQHQLTQETRNNQHSQSSLESDIYLEVEKRLKVEIFDSDEEPEERMLLQVSPEPLLSRQLEPSPARGLSHTMATYDSGVEGDGEPSQTSQDTQFSPASQLSRESQISPEPHSSPKRQFPSATVQPQSEPSGRGGKISAPEHRLTKLAKPLKPKSTEIDELESAKPSSQLSEKDVTDLLKAETFDWSDEYDVESEAPFSQSFPGYQPFSLLDSSQQTQFAPYCHPSSEHQTSSVPDPFQVQFASNHQPSSNTPLDDRSSTLSENPGQYQSSTQNISLEDMEAERESSELVLSEASQNNYTPESFEQWRDGLVYDMAGMEYSWQAEMMEIYPMIHHFNWLGDPIVERSDTPPEVSLFIILTGGKACLIDGSSRNGVILRQAIKYIDPILYEGDWWGLERKGHTFIEKITGNVVPFYTNMGTWVNDPHCTSDYGGSYDPVCPSTYEFQPGLPFNGWFSTRNAPTRAQFWDHATRMFNSKQKNKKRNPEPYYTRSPLAMCTSADTDEVSYPYGGRAHFVCGKVQFLAFPEDVLTYDSSSLNDTRKTGQTTPLYDPMQSPVQDPMQAFVRDLEQKDGEVDELEGLFDTPSKLSVRRSSEPFLGGKPPVLRQTSSNIGEYKTRTGVFVNDEECLCNDSG